MAAEWAHIAAHVKWFEDPSRYPLRTDLILSGRTAVLVGVAVVALGLLYLLRHLVGDPHWPELGFLQKMAIGVPTLLAVQAAITLVHAAVQPTLFVPNMPLPLNGPGLAVAALEALIAFSFITGIADWVAAIALIGLVVLGFLLFPFFDVLDQLYWAGIGVVILIIGRFAADVTQERPWFKRRGPAWSARAVAALRVIAGLAIVSPALSEKIWDPDLGGAFMADHPDFNFVRSLFGQFWFTDDRFVLAAGVIEATIGLLLISGLLTRVVILFMWVPFNVGVPFLPPQELIGHLPIFGIMYLLLVHSAGIAPGESLDRPAAPGSPRAQPEPP